MFESLGGRLQDVFKSFRGETRLTPENIEAALREIRLALLEADVNFKVVKAFVDRVRDRAMDAATGPRVILLLGLQGAGKTTTAGKLGKWLTQQGKHPLLVSTDVKRPAAIEQLNVVGRKGSLRVHDPAGLLDPVARARRGRRGREPGLRHRDRRYGRTAAHR